MNIDFPFDAAVPSGILCALKLCNLLPYYGSVFFEHMMNSFFDELCENLSAFIQLHYVVNRNDTPFWKFVKEELIIYDLLVEIFEKISQSKLDQLVVTDTIPLSEEAQKCKKIRIVTMAPTLAEAIRRVNNEESISAMFL